MTSGKNNSDISTCQCDTNPQDVGKRQEDEWKKGGLDPHNALVQWRISTMKNVVVTPQWSQSVRQLLYCGLTSIHTQAQKNWIWCNSVSYRQVIHIFTDTMFVCFVWFQHDIPPPPPHPNGPGLPHSRDFLITHNDAPQSVGHHWTSDQLVAETSTWQHTTLTTNRHPCPQWDSNPQSQQASGRRRTP